MANTARFKCNRKCGYETTFEEEKEGVWCCTQCGERYLIDAKRSMIKSSVNNGSGMGLWNAAQLGPPKPKI